MYVLQQLLNWIMNDLIPSVSSDLCSFGSLLNNEVFIIRPTISYTLHLSCPCKVSNDDFLSSWLTTVLARALYCFTFNDFFILPYLDDSLLYEVLKNLRTSLIVALFITSFLCLSHAFLRSCHTAQSHHCLFYLA